MLALKQPPFKESVIAHWSSDSAPKTYGAKHASEIADVDFTVYVVGERCVVGRSESESTRGRTTSETVGLSSENIGENPMHRKTKGSCTRLVLAGLGGS